MRQTFTGRAAELQDLGRFLAKKTASLIVVKGRRRIGKSRLINEFASRNKIKLSEFVGLPPEQGVTAQMQRDEFVRQLGFSGIKAQDWGDIFELLADKVADGRVVIFLDEISWMASDDPTFQGKLKNIWDLRLKKNPQLLLVLCGSVSSWLDKNIISSTGFVGRISYVLTLRELPLVDCNQFWNNVGGVIAAYEKLKVLSVTGGVPRYLEEINPALSAEENIKNMCFKEGSILFTEFDHIFSDIFAKRSAIYKNILEHIAMGHYDNQAIYEKLNITGSGLITEYLADLENAGFIKRDYTWHLTTGKKSKLSKYRISDNYVRFYLKYIEPNKDRVISKVFANSSIYALPGWDTIMGLQFENLVLANRERVKELLGIRSDDVTYDNPFFQTKTARQQGCQIDYLIQTRFNTLYVCEIKFSKNIIGAEVIEAVQEKIARLKIPKGISCRSVLIHVNGVSMETINRHYFSNVIDFSQLLAN